MTRWLVLLLAALPARALAHGPPVGATEIIAHSASEVALVRLTRGFVNRAPDGMHFLCPESFGTNTLAPAAAITNGPMFVAGESLYTVEQDGSFALHPVQSGAGFAATSHGEDVLAVFHAGTKWQLRRVTASSNDVLRDLDGAIDALAATADEVSLLHFEDRTIVVDTFALGGELRRSVTWLSESFVADARLRVAGGQLYAIVWGRSAPWVTLGRVAESYTPLLKGNVDIAGPLASGATTLVSVDGALQTIEGSAIDTGADRVTCLAESDGKAYACARGDLLRVDASGLGAPWFEMSTVREPSYAQLNEAQRADCTVRWLDVGVDLAVARDAGVGDAGGSMSMSRSRSGDGCSAGGGSWAGILLAMFLLRRPCRGSAGSADRRRA